MPLRSAISYLPRGGIPRFHRQFHETSRSRSGGEGKNHYEVLGIGRDATAQEIKKSFYALSKTYHPDHNPSDPDAASQKFINISQAYNTLSNPTLRSTYDTTTFPASIYPQNQRHPQGSYFSQGAPAGGRPASGLSRRRTQFRGPPASFYRSGGWGNQSAKRAEHEPQGHKDENFDTNHDKNGNDGSWVYESSNQTWNRKIHLDTHTTIDERRLKRAREMMEEDEKRRMEGGPWSPSTMFLCVAGAFTVVVAGAGGYIIGRN